LNVPFIPETEIEKIAEAFLAEYHPEALEPVPVVPTPIELIIEKNLGLEIVLFRGYRDRFGIDGSLSTDMSNVTVDEHVFDNYSNRLRFTLAHEVGHYVLHREQLVELAADTPAEWTQSILGIPSGEYKKMEIQANIFAGHILVPTNKLITALDEARRKLAEGAHGLRPEEISPTALSYLAGDIADQFHVSTQVVEIRMRKFI
jgi:hypothetical protein